MIYYATASTPRVREAMCADLLGQIITPAAGNRLEPWVNWIADNGIYSNAYPGNPGYLRWLDTHADARSRCRFAVAPDVVADHQGTLERSWPMLRPIRHTVGRVALCAQNGATAEDMPWDYIDAVFLAGIVECAPCGWVPALESLPQTTCPYCGRQLTEWKIGATAAAITAEAKRRGLWVHMGRVNSHARLDRARQMGVDSADGTYLAYGPDINLIRLLGWLQPDDWRWIRAERSDRTPPTKPRRTRGTEHVQRCLWDASTWSLSAPQRQATP
ncbi:hypothetical protein [Salinispora arenicola]|uniref:hypothetical protein n=1 Tax=Salinispora arenicola TaxID=168697 RepID=UPI0027DC612F|nr:hypothetical protein [Salinispora arenicola]